MGKTPQQPYKEILTKEGIEFRYYPAAVMATVRSKGNTYTGNSSNYFRALAGYIFGNNEKQDKIAMTAPVHMTKEDGQSAMSFVMPEGYTLQNLPKPNSKAVELHTAPEEYIAAIRFGGYASDSEIEEKKKKLKSALDALHITYDNNFRFLGYNAPWDFLFRRNEVIVSISKDDALKLK